MTARNLAEVAFKIIGVFGVVLVLAKIPTLLLRTEFEPYIFGLTRYLIVSLAIEAVAAVSLIFFGGALARWLIPETGSLQTTIAAPELRRIVFVGLVILFFGIKDAAELVLPTLIDVSWDQSSTLGTIWETDRVWILVVLIEIIFGTCLLLGRDALVRIWMRLRGRVSPEIEAQNE